MKIKVESAYIEITNQCNLDCCICYNSSGANHIKKEMSLADIQQSIQVLRKLGARKFSFSGGEPLLYSRIDELLDLMQIYPDATYTFVTNGTIHNNRLFELYQNDDRFNIQLSLDGSREEVYEKTRGKNHYDRVRGFLDQLRHPTKKPLLKMVLSKYNYFDIEDFYKFCYENHALPEFAFVNQQGNAKVFWGNLNLSQKEKYQAMILIRDLNEKYQMKVFVPFCTFRCPLSRELDYLAVCVKTDGSLQPCQLLYDDFFTLTNVLHFDEILFRERVLFVSGLVRLREQTDYGCSTCCLRHGCCKGCMALAFHQTGDPLACDEHCSYRRLQILNETKRKLIR